MLFRSRRGQTTTPPRVSRPPFPRPVQIAKPIQSTLPATWTEHSLQKLPHSKAARAGRSNRTTSSLDLSRPSPVDPVGDRRQRQPAFKSLRNRKKRCWQAVQRNGTIPMLLRIKSSGRQRDLRIFGSRHFGHVTVMAVNLLRTCVLRGKASIAANPHEERQDLQPHSHRPATGGYHYDAPVIMNAQFRGIISK